MKNIHYLNLLHQGVITWNKWRDNNIHLQPQLIDANLRGINLQGIVRLVDH